MRRAEPVLICGAVGALAGRNRPGRPALRPSCSTPSPIWIRATPRRPGSGSPVDRRLAPAATAAAGGCRQAGAAADPAGLGIGVRAPAGRAGRTRRRPRAVGQRRRAGAAGEGPAAGSRRWRHGLGIVHPEIRLRRPADSRGWLCKRAGGCGRRACPRGRGRGPQRPRLVLAAPCPGRPVSALSWARRDGAGARLQRAVDARRCRTAVPVRRCGGAGQGCRRWPGAGLEAAATRLEPAFRPDRPVQRRRGGGRRRGDVWRSIPDRVRRSTPLRGALRAEPVRGARGGLPARRDRRALASRRSGAAGFRIVYAAARFRCRSDIRWPAWAADRARPAPGSGAMVRSARAGPGPRWSRSRDLLRGRVRTLRPVR